MRIVLLILLTTLCLPVMVQAEEDISAGESYKFDDASYHSLFLGGTIFNLGPLRFSENSEELRLPFIWWAYGVNGGYEYSLSDGLLLGVRAGNVVTRASIATVEIPQNIDPEREYYGRDFAHIVRGSAIVGKSFNIGSKKNEFQLRAVIGPSFTWFSDSRMSGFHLGVSIGLQHWFGKCFGLFLALAETFDCQWVRDTEAHNRANLEDAYAFNFFLNLEMGMRIRF